MKRNIDMSEVSDGKLYTSRDMVRLGCEDCKGCSACCHGMGDSIVLDPYDIYQLTKGLGGTFEQLLAGKIELHLVDGLILPSLSMAGEDECCPFLDKNGRCSIHAFRPGICRLFPLGRIYEDGSFRYFLQVHECKKQNRTKVKISKWLEIPDLRRYEAFINDWHSFLEAVEQDISEVEDVEKRKQISLSLLNLFYRNPYDTDREFYMQFYERLHMLENVSA